MIQKASPGQDVPFDEKWVDASRKFGNKLWNAAKYVEINSTDEIKFEYGSCVIQENIWILSRFNEMLDQFNMLMEEYKIAEAYDMLYSFLWSELFDWYFEFTKTILKSEKDSIETQAVLRSVFMSALKMLNPAMAFVTEELWSQLKGEGILINTSWPESYSIPDSNIKDVELIKYFTTNVRNFRIEHNLPYSEKIDLISFNNLDIKQVITQIF